MATSDDDLARLTAILAGPDPDPPPADLSHRVFVQWCEASSPLGDVFVASTDRGVCLLRTVESVGDAAGFCDLVRERMRRPVRHSPRPPAGVLATLRTGRPRGLRLDLRDVSAFDGTVLAAVTRIPVGEIRPYGWLAAQIGRPRAARAVAAALGRNPVPLLIPCHRVTRSDGHIGGYVFGGAAKERLLRREGVDVDEVLRLAADRVFFLGSDTTNIVCFPTCHNARRITTAHRRGFRSVAEARRAGYRPCKSCRPGAA